MEHWRKAQRYTDVAVPHIFPGGVGEVFTDGSVLHSKHPEIRTVAWGAAWTMSQGATWDTCGGLAGYSCTVAHAELLAVALVACNGNGALTIVTDNKGVASGAENGILR